MNYRALFLEKSIIFTDIGFVYLRPDLKIILMSATLNAEMFSKYFGMLFWCSIIYIKIICNFVKCIIKL